VLGIHAWRLVKQPGSAFHLAAVRVVLPVAIVAAPLQVLTGDFAAKHLAEYQPTKLAAAEALLETQRGAPLSVGGVIRVPKLLSVLAHGDPDAEVQGLRATPRDEWPPVTIVHVAFQVMVGCGLVMLALAAWAAWLLARKKPLAGERRFLWAATAGAPLGLCAVEAGWIVTEVGRQPWIIVGVMRTADAVTPMPNLVISLAITSGVYLLLGVIVAVLLARYVVGKGTST
jgi:cytochrome d ubiquinol oxidase subunit I